MSTTIKRIMFTGGPHGGKSSFLEDVRVQLQKAGYHVFIVRESATRSISAIGSEVHRMLQAPGGGHLFQVALTRNQLVEEQGVEELAYFCEKELHSLVVILCDRGLLDGLGFVEDQKQWQAVVSELEYDIDESIGRAAGLPAFDLILHLESCSAHDPKWYHVKSHETHTVRLQDREAAARADRKLKAVYEGFSGYKFIHFAENFDEKRAVVLASVFEMLEGS